jgi:DNA-binding transcriptional LysR family regulator
MSLSNFEVYKKVGELLASPRPILSWLALSRAARLQEDKTQRAVKQLEAHFGRPLIVVDNHRLCLTEAGRILLRLTQQMSALADHGEQAAEVVTFQAEPDMAAMLLPDVLPGFWDLWGSLVCLRLFPLDNAVRKNVSEGTVLFGLGLAEVTETLPAAEVLGQKVPWILLVPENHRLNESQGQIAAGQIGGQDRLLVSSLAAGSQGLEKFLAGVPRSNLIECDGAIALAKAGIGLPIVPDLFGNQPCEGFTKLALAGTEHVQPRLILPRSGALPEPVEVLIAAIRRVVESRCVPEPADAPPIPRHNGSAVEIPFTIPVVEMEEKVSL